jgi:hypothetical protein
MMHYVSLCFAIRNYYGTTMRKILKLVFGIHMQLDQNANVTKPESACRCSPINFFPEPEPHKNGVALLGW